MNYTINNSAISFLKKEQRLSSGLETCSGNWACYKFNLQIIKVVAYSEEI